MIHECEVCLKWAPVDKNKPCDNCFAAKSEERFQTSISTNDSVAICHALNVLRRAYDDTVSSLAELRADKERAHDKGSIDLLKHDLLALQKFKRHQAGRISDLVQEAVDAQRTIYELKAKLSTVLGAAGGGDTSLRDVENGAHDKTKAEFEAERKAHELTDHRLTLEVKAHETTKEKLDRKGEALTRYAKKLEREREGHQNTFRSRAEEVQAHEATKEHCKRLAESNRGLLDRQVELAAESRPLRERAMAVCDAMGLRARESARDDPRVHRDLVRLGNEQRDKAIAALVALAQGGAE